MVRHYEISRVIFNLTLYDATYLELAIRMNLPLATFDKQLQEAAKQKKLIILQ